MERDTQPGDLQPRSLTRYVDARISLTWLLSAVAVIVSGGFGLYHQLGSQGETLKAVQGDIKDLKISVQSGNQATATLQGQIEVLKFRVENLEGDKRVAR